MLTTFFTTRTTSHLTANVVRRPGFVRRKAVALAAMLAILTVWMSPTRAAELETLEIAGKTGVHTFAVEVARSDKDRAAGLMHRKELPEGRGMLFDFTREQEVSMWMENTYIPLDMIFIRKDGRILSIAENTTPLSRAIVSSGGLALGVLEVIGGTSRKLGITPGDRVAHPMFKR